MDPVTRKPVVNQIADSIVEYIHDKQLPVDSKLPSEQTLCKELNVGRSSLREAYRLLHAQGVITLKPGKGAYISNPATRSDIVYRSQWLSQNKIKYLDILEVRAHLEPFAIRLAAERITDDQLALLKQNLDMFQENMYKPDRSMRLAELDAQFHEIIFRSSRNLFLCSINDMISQEITEYRYTFMKIEERRENTYLPHLKIYFALKERSVERSVEAMIDHLAIAEKDMVDLAKEQDAEQSD